MLEPVQTSEFWEPASVTEKLKYPGKKLVANNESSSITTCINHPLLLDLISPPKNRRSNLSSGLSEPCYNSSLIFALTNHNFTNALMKTVKISFIRIYHFYFLKNTSTSSIGRAFSGTFYTYVGSWYRHKSPWEL